MNRIFILIFFITNIFSDVMYEMERTSQGFTLMGEETTHIRNFIKGDLMRTEIKMKHPILGKIERITIVRLDKGIVWILDNEHKEYSEFPLKSDSTEIQTAKIPEILPAIKIEKLKESKEILKINCDKYTVSLTYKSDNDTIEMLQTIWLGKDFVGYDEIMGFNKKMLNTINFPSVPGIDNIIIKEFQKSISEIEGFPLELELNLKMQNQELDISLLTRNIVKKISTVPISNKVFEIPEGYQLNTSVKTN